MRDYSSFFIQWFGKKSEIFIKLLQFRDFEIIQIFIAGFVSAKCREIATQRFGQNSETSRQAIFYVNVLRKKIKDLVKKYRFVVGNSGCKNDVGIFQRLEIISEMEVYGLRSK